MTGKREALAGARVVVTGGLGLIGSCVARSLAPLADVLVVDALIPTHGGDRANVAGAAVSVVEHDLRDLGGLRELLEGSDVVFNLAGQRSHTDSVRDPHGDLEHNCRAQLTLLEACRSVRRPPLVVYGSTRQVYGRPRRVPVDELAPVRPIDVNGVHAAAAEHYHRLYSEIHGVPSVVLRLTHTYGPGMRIVDARQGFLGAWVGALLEGRPFEVWDGTQRRDFTYVDDAARALILAAARGDGLGAVYNLGGESASLLEIAELLVRINGRGTYSVRALPDDAAAIDIGDYTADDSAFRAATGWEPRVGLEDGLRRTLDHYRRSSAEARAAL